MEIDTIKLGKYATETRASEIGCTTLVHGDIWANNIMVKFNDDGSISDEVLSIIDWQTTFEG
jgi:aminoglycoside phosphotransferase (APT) family kinase protein